MAPEFGTSVKRILPILASGRARRGGRPRWGSSIPRRPVPRELSLKFRNPNFRISRIFLVDRRPTKKSRSTPKLRPRLARPGPGFQTPFSAEIYETGDSDIGKRGAANSKPLAAETPKSKSPYWPRPPLKNRGSPWHSEVGRLAIRSYPKPRPRLANKNPRTAFSGRTPPRRGGAPPT